jgi:hypothetical protein
LEAAERELEMMLPEGEAEEMAAEQLTAAGSLSLAHATTQKPGLASGF